MSNHAMHEVVGDIWEDVDVLAVAPSAEEVKQKSESEEGYLGRGMEGSKGVQVLSRKCYANCSLILW